MKGKRVIATVSEIVSCSEHCYQNDCDCFTNDLWKYDIESQYHNEKYPLSSYIVYDQELRISYPWNNSVVESIVKCKSYDYKRCVGEKLVIRVSDGSITQIEEYSAAVRFSLIISLSLLFMVFISAGILYFLNK